MFEINKDLNDKEQNLDLCMTKLLASWSEKASVIDCI